MSSTVPSKDSRPEVWALTALPPPVDGMTLLTEKVIQRIQQEQPITVVNWSAGAARRSSRTRALRSLRAARSLGRLLLHGRVRNARLFITANSGAGLHMTRLLVRAGRALGYSICLHHHTYGYIDQYDPRMARIDRIMTAGDIHLVHCPQMADEFRARYPTEAQFEFLYPSIVSIPLGQARLSAKKPLRLGHLAHLSVAKGLDLVLETFRTLRQKNHDVYLSLAGPFHTAEAQRMVEDAVQANAGRIEHLGGVYGDRKTEFFDSIDCFLFPSQTESWGIVLNEAMAAGVPVIATDRGCVRTFVTNGAGLVVGDEKRYVDDAVRQVEAWIDSQADYSAASRSAISQADHLHQEAAIQLEHLVAHICLPTESV